MNVSRSAKVFSVIVGVLSSGMAGANSQEIYPSRPIKFIIPYAAGAVTDISARIVANALQVELGQPIVVENRPGAGGNIGTALASRARGDGYTIMLATNVHAINQSLYPELGYDLQKSFAPVSTITSSSMLLVVNGQLPAQSVSELVNLAKTKSLLYSSGGNGSSGHLYMALLEQKAGMKMVHVPYSAVAAGITDLLSNRVQATFSTVLSTVDMVKAGQLRALAIAAPQRSPLIPDVPTLTEAGIEGVEERIWQGIAVPAETPKEIIGRLNSAIVKVLAQDAVKAQLEQQGVAAYPSSPKEFDTLIANEIIRWGAVIKQGNISIQ